MKRLERFINNGPAILVVPILVSAYVADAALLGLRMAKRAVWRMF